jgi:hypothetical protein
MMTTYSEYTTPLYQAWQGMNRRCYSSSYATYLYYGGRGIKVCGSWRYSFVRFRKWAVSNGYEPDLSLDRIDNNGNYEPTNCRWVPKRQQMWNRRNTPLIEAFGETKSIPEWAEDARCIVSYETLRARFKRGGWSAEEAISMPMCRPGRGERRPISCPA